jgi:hypothetical protein
MKAQGISKYGLPVLAYVLLAGCGSLGSQPQHPPVKSEDMLGAWVLQSVGGNPPSTVNIKSWQITFSTNQQWVCAGEMSGTSGGVKVSGSGTWKITSGTLEYTAGDNKGRSLPAIQDGTLTLSPDPVIMPDGGKTQTVTTYKREN